MVSIHYVCMGHTTAGLSLFLCSLEVQEQARICSSCTGTLHHKMNCKSEGKESCHSFPDDANVDVARLEYIDYTNQLHLFQDTLIQTAWCMP